MHSDLDLFTGQDVRSAKHLLQRETALVLPWFALGRPGRYLCGWDRDGSGRGSRYRLKETAGCLCPRRERQPKDGQCSSEGKQQRSPIQVCQSTHVRPYRFFSIIGR
jgi:hypothetical protein